MALGGYKYKGPVQTHACVKTKLNASLIEFSQMFITFAIAALVAASYANFRGWVFQSPELNQLSVVRWPVETVIIPNYVNIHAMDTHAAHPHTTSFVITPTAAFTEIFVSSATKTAKATHAFQVATQPTPTRALPVEQVKITPTLPRVVPGNRPSMQTPKVTTAACKPPLQRPSARHRSYQAKSCRKFGPYVDAAAAAIAAFKSSATKSLPASPSQQRNVTLMSGVRVGAVGASEALRREYANATLINSARIGASEVSEVLRVSATSPAAGLRAKMSEGSNRIGVRDLYLIGSASSTSSHRALGYCLLRVWTTLPLHQQRGSMYILLSLAVAFLMSFKFSLKYVLAVVKPHLRRNLAEVLETARCGSVQNLISGAWHRSLRVYKKILVSLMISSPMCINFPSNHDPSTAEPETGLCAPQNVDTGSVVACAVPKLKSTSLTVSHPAWPRERVARLRLVSVSGPCRVDKVHPSPASQQQRAEKDGVDHKDTFAFAFDKSDPWACQVVTTLLQIQDLALSPPSSQYPPPEKPGRDSRRDDDETVRPLRFNKSQECMPAFKGQGEDSSGHATGDLDLGTRVANCLALRRYHSDCISNIFEGSNQARRAVFSFAAEVGRTESLRKYKKEIEYIESAARREPQPTQSRCSIGFNHLYTDENYGLIVEATKFEKSAVDVLDKLNEYHGQHRAELQENARRVATPEPEKIMELVNLYFDNPKASIAKQLRTIEKALETRAAIDKAYIEQAHGLLDILRVVIVDYRNACYDYIDADEGRYEELEPDYHAWLLTKRLSVYRQLPT